MFVCKTNQSGWLRETGGTLWVGAGRGRIRIQSGCWHVGREIYPIIREIKPGGKWTWSCVRDGGGCKDLWAVIYRITV